MLGKDNESEREGVGGWISKMVNRGKSEEANGSGSGKYRPVGQDDEEQ